MEFYKYFGDALQEQFYADGLIDESPINPSMTPEAHEKYRKQKFEEKIKRFKYKPEAQS